MNAGKRYIASDSGRPPWTEALQHCPVPYELKLKVGAQVMLLKNLNLSKGLSNGARGTPIASNEFMLIVIDAMASIVTGVVVGFDESRDGYPVVRFVSGVSLTVMPAKWTIEHPLGTAVAVRPSSWLSRTSCVSSSDASCSRAGRCL